MKFEFTRKVWYDKIMMIRANIRKRRLVGLFLAGGVLFNYPILSLFNLRIMVLGIPLLYLYIFSAWTLLILLIIFVTRP